MTVLAPTGHDDTAMLLDALENGKVIRLSDGVFRMGGGILLDRQGIKLRGEGPGATELQFTTPDSTIRFAPYLSDTEISGLSITRSVPPAVGGNGITTHGVSCNHALLRDLKITGHHIGLALGPTGWSEVDNVIVAKCVSDGVQLVNTDFLGTLQWSFRRVLSQFNAGRGFMVSALQGPSHVTLGTWYDVATFANSGCGVAVVGQQAIGVHGLRINGAFIGGDGNHELFLDSHGGQHVIAGLFTELAGRGPTGPGYDTPASGIGSGFVVTANNGSVKATNCRASGNSQRGFSIAAGPQFLGVGLSSDGNLLPDYVLCGPKQHVRDSWDGVGLVNLVGPASIGGQGA